MPDALALSKQCVSLEQPSQISIRWRYILVRDCTRFCLVSKALKPTAAFCVTGMATADAIIAVPKTAQRMETRIMNVVGGKEGKDVSRAAEE